MPVVTDNSPCQSGSLPSSPEEVIVDLIQRDDEYVGRCILFLFDQQEEDEQARHKTIYRNMVGFSAADAGIFTSIANRLLSGESMSADDLAKCRMLMKNGLPRLGKYRSQLVNAQSGSLQ